MTGAPAHHGCAVLSTGEVAPLPLVGSLLPLWLSPLSVKTVAVQVIIADVQTAQLPQRPSSGRDPCPHAAPAPRRPVPLAPRVPLGGWGSACSLHATLIVGLP